MTHVTVPLHAIRLFHLILHLDNGALSRVKSDPDSVEARVKRPPIEGCFPRSPASPFVSIVIIEWCLRITRSHALPQTSQSARSRSSPITPAYLVYRLDDSRTTRTDGRNNAYQRPGAGGTFILELILKCILYIHPFFFYTSGERNCSRSRARMYTQFRGRTRSLRLQNTRTRKPFVPTRRHLGRVRARRWRVINMQEKNDPYRSTRGLRTTPNASVNVSIETAVSLKGTPKKSIWDLRPRTIHV